MQRTAWIPMMSALALSACATAPREAAPPAPAPVSAPAPAAAEAPPARPSMTWTTTPKDGGTQLAYGVPNSGVMALALHCVPGTGTVTVSAPYGREWPGARATEQGWVDAAGRPQPWSTRVVVQSDASTHPAAAEVTVDEMNGGVWVDAPVPLAEALWQSFRRSGRIEVRGLGESIRPGALAPELAESFLRKCGEG